MVDIFALSISHGLLALTIWRLLARDDLFEDSPAQSKDRNRRLGKDRGRASMKLRQTEGAADD
jgi:hypothetical protein